MRTPRTYALFFDYALIALARTSVREERRRGDGDGDGGRDYRCDRERTAHFLEYTKCINTQQQKNERCPALRCIFFLLAFWSVRSSLDVLCT